MPELGPLGGLQMGRQVLAELDPGEQQVAAGAYAEPLVGEAGRLLHHPTGRPHIGLDEVPVEGGGPLQGAAQSRLGAVGAAHAVGDPRAVEELPGGQQPGSGELPGGHRLPDAGPVRRRSRRGRRRW